jgi:multiple sugar transport system substrate-binding protein
MKFVTKCIAVMLGLGVLGTAAPAVAQETLVVWWTKGFYKSDVDALYAAIKTYEQ